MSSLNKVTLIGNVGGDPEIKTFQDGKPVATFSLATSFTWKDKNTGEKKTQTEWHRVVCFVSNICIIIQQYVRKGSKIYIEGSIKYREYEKDGQKKNITEIVLTDFGSKLLLLNKKDDNEEIYHSSSQNEIKKIQFDLKDLDDEIPF
jgi:single-strand DNA-binding protein